MTTIGAMATPAPAPAPANRAKLPYFDSLSWFQCTICRRWRMADFDRASAAILQQQQQQQAPVDAEGGGGVWECRDGFWSDEMQTWAATCDFIEDKPATCVNPNPGARNELDAKVVHARLVAASIADKRNRQLQPQQPQQPDAIKRAKTGNNHNHNDSPSRSSAPSSSAAPLPPDYAASAAAAAAAAGGTSARAAPFFDQQQLPSRSLLAYPPSSSFTTAASSKFDAAGFIQFIHKATHRLLADGANASLTSCSDIILNDKSSANFCLIAFDEIREWIKHVPEFDRELQEIKRSHPFSSQWT